MAEGAQSPEKSIKPPELKQEAVQYKDRGTAIRISGEKGAKFDFYGENKHSPEESGHMGIVVTESGNRYIIAENSKGDTYVVDARSSDEQGKLVALRRSGEDASTKLPPLEFGKPWEIGPIKTTEVKQLVLETGQVALGDEPLPGHSQVDAPSPFANYRKLLRQARPGENFE
jgi:hypothetical protein